MSREFFKAVQEKSPRTTRAELRSPNGVPITKQKEIEDACVAFYRKLYTSPGSDEQTMQGEQNILDAITTRILPFMAITLGQPLSELELHRAASALAKEKVPGPDGISMNFFHSFLALDWSQLLLDDSEFSESRAIS